MVNFDQKDNSIVISGFEAGIADSPFNGISDMRNVNIISVPGEASVGFSTSALTLPAVSGSVVSADAGADTVTVGSLTGTLANGQAVTFTGASLPGGIVAATTYWIFNLSGNTFQLASLPDGSGGALNITSSGTGTFASINIGKCINRAFDGDKNSTYMIDTNGRVWGNVFAGGVFVFMNNTLTASSHGNGLVYYRGYLFIFRNDKIDYINTTGYGFTANWQTLNTSSGVNNSHYSLVGQDDTVYYCDGSFLGSFFQKPGTTFDPTNAATYTWAQQALALPSIDIAQCLEELGVNLLVGGKLNKIYPWNRIATSFTYPILLSENFVQRMVTVNNKTYIFVGNRGRIYETTGYMASFFKKVPDHLSGTVEPYFMWGDATFSKNQLYFGVSATTNGGSAINQYGGLWAIDLDTGAIRLSNQLSYGTYAGLASAIIAQYQPPGTFIGGAALFIGWDSGASTFGIDGTSSSPYTGSQAYIDTDLIPIGTKLMPKNFTQAEYRLTKPMVSGESVLVQWRTDFSQTFGSNSFLISDSTVGNFSGISTSIPWKNAQWVQLRAILNSTASSPSYTRLKELRMR